MRVKVFDTALIIDYSFIVVISLAILFGADNILSLLLFSGLHELGHLIALLLCKKRADSIRLSFYGAAIKYSAKLTVQQEIFVLLSGFLVNLALYLILHDSVNLALFIVNILPIYPLDGGRIIKIILPKASVYISYISLALIFAAAIILLLKYKIFSLLLICVYLLIYSLYY